VAFRLPAVIPNPGGLLAPITGTYAPDRWLDNVSRRDGWKGTVAMTVSRKAAETVPQALGVAAYSFYHHSACTVLPNMCDVTVVRPIPNVRDKTGECRASPRCVSRELTGARVLHLGNLWYIYEPPRFPRQVRR
jgi:hypothetical protein